MNAPTIRETADHVPGAGKKVVQTPMHRDAAKATLALKTADHAELARLAEAATPGPWHAAGGYLTVRDPDSGSFSSTIYHLDEMGQKGPSLPYQAVPFAKPSDAAFIAAANPATVLSLLSKIAALRGERERLRAAVSKSNDEICQSLGKALGYPWFKDDQANFPGSTESDGVCVGDHVAESIADEAARRLTQAERQRDELRKALDYARYHVLQSPCSDKQACLDQIDQAIASQGADQ